MNDTKSSFRASTGPSSNKGASTRTRSTGSHQSSSAPQASKLKHIAQHYNAVGSFVGSPQVNGKVIHSSLKHKSSSLSCASGNHTQSINANVILSSALANTNINNSRVSPSVSSKSMYNSPQKLKKSMVKASSEQTLMGGRSEHNSASKLPFGQRNSNLPSIHNPASTVQVLNEKIIAQHQRASKQFNLSQSSQKLGRTSSNHSTAKKTAQGLIKMQQTQQVMASPGPKASFARPGDTVGKKTPGTTTTVSSACEETAPHQPNSTKSKAVMIDQRYEIRKKIDEGTYAKVYLAQDWHKNGSYVVLKILRPRAYVKPIDRAQVKKEIENHQKL